MNRPPRGAAVALLLLAVAFAAGGAAGFVYGHDPQPGRVNVRLAREAPRDGERFVSGTITRLDDDTLELATGAGTVVLKLAGAPIEELVPAEPADFAVGAPVNLGGTQSDGPVLTGVVLFEGQARP